MTNRRQPQQHFEEKLIPDDDGELVSLLEKQYNNADAAKEYRKAKSDLNAVLKTKGLEEGYRYRIGQYVIIPKPRNGGGFEVPAWTGMVYEIDTVE